MAQLTLENRHLSGPPVDGEEGGRSSMDETRGRLEYSPLVCSIEMTARGPRQLSDDSGAAGVLTLEARDAEGELAISDNQMSPPFNVETSATDSGVSNTSSTTSEFIGIEHLLVVNPDGVSVPNGEPATLQVSSATVGDGSFPLDRTNAPQFVLCVPSGTDRASGWLDALDLECGVTGDRLSSRRHFRGEAVPPRSLSAGGMPHSVYTPVFIK